jgi:hypothetical protein
MNHKTWLAELEARMRADAARFDAPAYYADAPPTPEALARLSLDDLVGTYLAELRRPPSDRPENDLSISTDALVDEFVDAVHRERRRLMR